MQSWWLRSQIVVVSAAVTMPFSTLLQVLNNGCHYTAIKAIAMVDDFEQEVLTRYSDHGQG